MLGLISFLLCIAYFCVVNQLYLWLVIEAVTHLFTFLTCIYFGVCYQGPVSGVSEPATFHQYLEAILAFSLHPSQVSIKIYAQKISTAASSLICENCICLLHISICGVVANYLAFQVRYPGINSSYQHHLIHDTWHHLRKDIVCHHHTSYAFNIRVSVTLNIHGMSAICSSALACAVDAYVLNAYVVDVYVVCCGFVCCGCIWWILEWFCL